MKLSIILPLLLFFILIFFYFTGIVLYHLNRRSHVHQLFLLIAMVLSLWMFDLSVFFSTESVDLLQKSCFITEISEILVYPLIIHFILQLRQSKKQLWLLANYLTMFLFLALYGFAFSNTYMVNVEMNQPIILSQFSTFQYQGIIVTYSAIYSLFIYLLLRKSRLEKEESRFQLLVYHFSSWIFLSNIVFLISRVLWSDTYFTLYTIATPIIIGVPFVFTAYLLFKYERKFEMKSIISTSFGLMDDSAKEKAYLYLSLGLIYMGYLSYAIEYFAGGLSFYMAIRPGIILFLIGHILYFVSISSLSKTVKEWKITILMAFATLFVLLYFQMSYVQLAGLGIPLIMILFTILFSNLNRLVFIALTSLGAFIYLWIMYPEIQYTMQSIDHFTGILLLIIFSAVAIYIHSVFQKRWNEYNRNAEILQLNSDLAHEILNKQMNELEILAMELLSKWIDFSSTSLAYLHVELDHGERQDIFFSHKKEVNNEDQKKYSLHQWENIKNDPDFKWDKPYNKTGLEGSCIEYSVERVEYLPLKYGKEVKGFLLSFYEHDKSEYKAFQLVLSDVLSYHLEEVSQKIGLERKLHQLAYYDQLTGLPNRVKFEEVFLDYIQKNEEDSRKCGLFVIDLNNFKEVNDQYGHQIGDELLRLYAQRLRETIREEDRISRYGGDEFLVFIPKIKSFQEAAEIKIRLQSIDHKAYHLNEKLSAITKASIGMALFPEDGKSLSQLMKVADQRMYKEKFVSKQNK